MPDHRSIVQTFTWQFYDLPPKFPRLIEFLHFWSHNLEGPLAGVRVGYAGIVQPIDIRHIKHEFGLN